MKTLIINYISVPISSFWVSFLEGCVIFELLVPLPQSNFSYRIMYICKRLGSSYHFIRSGEL